MASKQSMIVSITRKHNRHVDIVAQLEAADFSVSELALPQEDSGICSIESQLAEQVAGIDLIIVYISAESAINVCVSALAKEAEKHGVRLISIWIDDVIAQSIPASIDTFSDALTPYTDALAGVFSGQSDPWLLPDGSEPPKRKIKKHTCG